MKVLNNVKHCDPIYLNIKDRLFTSLTMLGCELEGSIISAMKENLLLCCRKFSAFTVAAMI